MFSTIWMWTHEWSDMCSRSALTPAACHHALICRSASTASSSRCRRRLPRAGRVHAGVLRRGARRVDRRAVSSSSAATGRSLCCASLARAACSAMSSRCTRARRVAGRPLAPAAVGPQLPGADVGRQRALERVEQVLAQRGVLDGRDELDAGVEVARHEIGRADEHARLRAALERVDARVLEEAAEHAHDRDVLRDALDPRAQAADPAHVEVHRARRRATRGTAPG